MAIRGPDRIPATRKRIDRSFDRAKFSILNLPSPTPSFFSRQPTFEALQISGGVGEKIGTIRGKGRRKGGLIACITARNRGMSRSKAAMRVGIARRGVLLPAGK